MSVQVSPAHMCPLHQRLLVMSANYSPQDPWMALFVATQVALFQGATADPKTHERLGGDITRIGELGCLACYKPDLFVKIVDAARTHDLGKVKTLGEQWVLDAQKKDTSNGS